MGRVGDSDDQSVGSMGAPENDHTDRFVDDSDDQAAGNLGATGDDPTDQFVDDVDDRDGGRTPSDDPMQPEGEAESMTWWQNHVRAKGKGKTKDDDLEDNLLFRSLEFQLPHA